MCEWSLLVYWSCHEKWRHGAQNLHSELKDYKISLPPVDPQSGVDAQSFPRVWGRLVLWMLPHSRWLSLSVGETPGSLSWLSSQSWSWRSWSHHLWFFCPWTDNRASSSWTIHMDFLRKFCTMLYDICCYASWCMPYTASLFGWLLWD